MPKFHFRDPADKTHFLPPSARKEHCGYASRFVFAKNAGHGNRKVTLPEALEWLWQGYRK